ncbi:MAG: hypothetical protein IJT94_07165 [Oscillibacter sp.]|nr:hypothetical protein [Oscillibacter sp.]
MLYDLTEKEAELIESFRLLQPRIQEPILSLVFGFRDIPSCFAEMTVFDTVRAYMLQNECDLKNSGK